MLRPHDDPALLRLLDHTLTLGVAGSSVVLGETSLALFDAKNEFMHMLRSAWQAMPGMYQRAARRDRADLIAAAHAVIVLSAFFDSVAASPVGPLRLSERKLKKLATDERPEDFRSKFVDGILNYRVEMPRQDLSYRDLSLQLSGYYSGLMDRLLRYLRNLHIWDLLSENDRAVLEGQAGKNNGVAAEAVKRYHRYRARLSAQVPEFGYWTNLWQQMRAEEALAGLIEQDVLPRLDEILRAVGDRTGLSGLRAIMGVVEAEQVDARWAELGLRYRDLFRRPVIDQRDQAIPEGLGLPSLRDAYVNPCFRAVDFQQGVLPSEARWWEANTHVRSDLLSYLAAYLSEPKACEVPLLLLGDPGAGKSVFTLALAATIGELGYRVVRVDLRDVSANARIAHQIDEALRDMLNRDVAWAELAAATAKGIPVVIFDGFDELLQTSGSNQSNYLEEVWEFQRGQTVLDRPMLAIVTSRTLVAHRARIPNGTAIVRLEPFGKEEIATWLATWNRANEQYRNSRGLEPLSAQTVSRYPDLACQPLLLLMLALYDAAGNALKDEQGELVDIELYERLLQEFTRRQVRKTHPKAGSAGVETMVDTELTGLSVAALAMFNRGQLHISEGDLDDDLRALMKRGQGAATAERNAYADAGFDERLTAAELLVDRFFFVHESRKRAGANLNATVNTYEFMHSTFGEYLVARIVYQALVDLLREADKGPRKLAAIGRSEVDDINDRLLSALLSFEILSAREAILRYVSLRVQQFDPPTRARLCGILAELVARHSCRHEPVHLTGYEPRRLDGLTRIALYTANLMLLAVTLVDPLPLGELFSEAGVPLPRWRKLAGVWQVGLDAAEWSSLIRSIEFLPGEHGSGAVTRFRDRAQEFSDPRIADVYLAAALICSEPTQRLLGAARSVARRYDVLLGTDGSAVSALLEVVLFDEDSVESVEHLDAAFLATQRLPETARSHYLSVIVRRIGGQGAPIADADVARLLSTAAEIAGQSDGGPELCAVIIDQARAMQIRAPELHDEWDAIIRKTAAQLSDLYGIRDPRTRLDAVLTLAEFELAGKALPGTPRFRENVAVIPLEDVVDEVTLPRLVRALCFFQPRTWINHHGASMLLHLPDRLLRLILPEQIDSIASAAFEGEDVVWVRMLRNRWEAARVGIAPDRG